MKIPLDTFEQIIDEKVLEQGLKHFKRGAVGDVLEAQPGVFEVLVADHAVTLNVIGNAVVKSSCPCAERRSPVCTHVAALIFFLQQETLGLPAPKKRSPAKQNSAVKTVMKTEDEKLAEAIEQLSIQELQRFVGEYCLRVRELRVALMARVELLHGKPTTGTYITHFEAELRGYFREELVQRFCRSAKDQLDRAEEMIRQEDIDRALPMVLSVIEMGARIRNNIYHDEKDLYAIVDRAFGLLRSSPVTKDPKRSKTVLRFCLKGAANHYYRMDRRNSDCLAIAVELVEEERDAAALRRLLDNEARQWQSDDRIDLIAVRLVERREGEAAVGFFLEANLDKPVIREIAFGRALKIGDHARATYLAVEAIRRGARSGSMDQGGWMFALNDVLTRAAEKRGSLALVRGMLFNPNVDGEAVLSLLKQHVPTREWSAYAEDLLEELRKRPLQHRKQLMDLLLLEERWEPLLALLRDEGTLTELQDYATAFPGKHRPALADAYAVLIRELLAGPNSVATYEIAADHLRVMMAMGQQVKAALMVEEIFRDYPKRHQLKSVLRQAFAPQRAGH